MYSFKLHVIEFEKSVLHFRWKSFVSTKAKWPLRRAKTHNYNCVMIQFYQIWLNYREMLPNLHLSWKCTKETWKNVRKLDIFIEVGVIFDSYKVNKQQNQTLPKLILCLFHVYFNCTQESVCLPSCFTEMFLWPSIDLQWYVVLCFVFWEKLMEKNIELHKKTKPWDQQHRREESCSRMKSSEASYIFLVDASQGPVI